MPPQFAKDLELAIRVYQLEAEVTRLQRENDALSKSELELASERNKFADLYDFAPLGYLILTIDAEIVDANLFAARLVGLERRQFLGQCLTDFIHADHREQFREFLTDPDESSGAGSCELKLRTGADQVLDVALQKRHVPEEDGRARIYLTIIDISSRKQIEAERSQLLDEKEEAVRELERTLAMLDALFEEAPVGLAFLDHTFRFQKLNRALAEINGLSIEAHLGKSPTELLPDLAPDMTIHRFEEVKRTGKPVQLQIERDSPLDPTKKRYWWAVYYPIYIRHQLWGIGVIVNENTAQKQAEAALQASHEARRISEERFRLALQDSPITVFNQDGDLRYTWVYNNVLLNDPADYIGKTDFDLWPVDQAAFVTRLKKEVIATGTEKREEIQLTVDGKTHFFDVRYAARHNASGEFVGLNGVSFDITNQKAAVLEMSRQRTLAKALANTVNAVHESVNLSEVLDFIMGSMANVIPHDLAEVLLIEYDHVHIARSRGYSQLQLSETVLPIDQPISQIPLLNMMLSSHQTLLISDLQGYKADNPIVTVSWLHGYVGAPLLWQQRVIGFINLMSTKRDFFAPEHAERLTIFAAQAALAIRNAKLHQEAQQAAVLQERQRLARDLHDAVSQSLYTSNVIAESLQILYQTHPSKVPENLEKLHILNRGALAEMRTLLLELRPEKLEATAMAELLQQLADAARARTGLRSKVIVKEDSDIPSDLKEALYRITQEAFTNIIKHANASHVHARYTYRDGAVKLVIEDDGQGFDMSNAATHRMGISNMQERMAAFGGSVEIESELGGGTVVTAVWGG